ncbi:MAG: M28 family metallopeptidase [Acidobacteriota bacterium]
MHRSYLWSGIEGSKLQPLAVCLVLLGLAAPAARAGTGTPGEVGTAGRQNADAVSSPRPRIGFLLGSRAAEARAERRFVSTPAPQQARRWLRDLTEEPHVAGTQADRRSAEYVREQLSAFGFETEIVTYEVLLNYPEQVSLRLVEPEPMELSLFEKGHPADKDSYSRAAFPAFHGYGASGSASGEVVYVNYGREQDFEHIEEMGISLRGRIVLARYGKVYRGLKVYQAERRGAAGILIYSDPADDGYMKGDIYPQGPMRPEHALQRGSVRFPHAGPGDPTTPGYASLEGVRRLNRKKLPGLASIPSLPVSYGEARKILSRLAGDRVPDEWQGGLPFAYHVGPGPASVEMAVKMDYALRPIWDVVARIRGTAEPDRWVILGNHRDAWAYGAVDPSSGTASLLEAARGLSVAIEHGWKPRRSLVLASWDAEEYGLVGSTEWVEEHLRELDARAVAYVNLDSSTSGPDLNVNGAPALRDLVLEVAADVREPRKGGSILQAWRGRKQRSWARTSPVCLHGPEQIFELRLGSLGSGSDFTPFAHHAGVASLDLGFDGPYGVYHSTLDNLYWMDHFGDPEYLYHTAAAQLYGLLAMRLTASEIVPLRYAAHARELVHLLDEMRRGVVRAQRREDAAEKPSEKRPLDPDFAALRTQIEAFGREAAALDAALEAVEASDSVPDPALARLNDALVRVERAFLIEKGLPGRPWFRHALYAPDLKSYYGSSPFPGLAQALDARDGALFSTQMEILIGRLGEATRRLRAALSLARSVPGFPERGSSR